MSESSEELRRQEIEVQKKQLFAQRVAAAAAAATAVSAANAAASLEEMRREARAAAAASAEEERKSQDIQREHLAAIETDARNAANDREYQRQVLFLKESDDITKLEALLDIFSRKLDWKTAPKDEKQREHWAAERDKTVSALFILPPLPQECDKGGAITKQILQLAASQAIEVSVALPESAVKLQTSIGEIDKERGNTQTRQKKAASDGRIAWILWALGSLLLLVGIGGIQDANGDMAVGYTVLGVAALVAVAATALSIRVMMGPRRREFREQLDELEVKKQDLSKRLQPLLDEASKKQRLAQAKADKEYDEAVEDCVKHWQLLVCRAQIQAFFEQQLWVSDQFTERFMKEIQRPFPTSCRADLTKLRKEQIESAYFLFTEAVKDMISGEISRSKHVSPLSNILVAELDAPAERQDQIENTDIMEFLEARRRELERQSKSYEYKDALCGKGILLEFMNDINERKPWESKVLRILRSGPSSLEDELPPRTANSVLTSLGTSATA